MTTFLLFSIQLLSLSVGVKAELIRTEKKKKDSSTSEKQSSENLMQKELRNWLTE